MVAVVVAVVVVVVVAVVVVAASGRLVNVISPATFVLKVQVVHVRIERKQCLRRLLLPRNMVQPSTRSRSSAASAADADAKRQRPASAAATSSSAPISKKSVLPPPKAAPRSAKKAAARPAPKAPRPAPKAAPRSTKKATAAAKAAAASQSTPLQPTAGVNPGDLATGVNPGDLATGGRSVLCSLVTRYFPSLSPHSSHMSHPILPI